VAPTKSKKGLRAKVRTFSATERDQEMLDAIARYHGTSKSAMLTGLVRKEFWRIFPNGTETVPPDQGVRMSDE
jgi:hypothetical protein